MLISVTNVVIKIENKCDRAEKSLFMFFNFKKTVYVKLHGLLFYVESWKLVVADLVLAQWRLIILSVIDKKIRQMFVDSFFSLIK